MFSGVQTKGSWSLVKLRGVTFFLEEVEPAAPATPPANPSGLGWRGRRGVVHGVLQF